MNITEIVKILEDDTLNWQYDTFNDYSNYEDSAIHGLYLGKRDDPNFIITKQTFLFSAMIHVNMIRITGKPKKELSKLFKQRRMKLKAKKKQLRIDKVEAINHGHLKAQKFIDL